MFHECFMRRVYEPQLGLQILRQTRATVATWENSSLVQSSRISCGVPTSSVMLRHKPSMGSVSIIWVLV